MPRVKPQPAWLHLRGWEGETVQEVEIIAETPKRYRVMPVGKRAVKLAGRERWLRPGETALVPKSAVTRRPV